MIPLKDTLPRWRTPYVTWGLIALNALVFLDEWSLPPRLLHAVLFAFGLVPAHFAHALAAGAFLPAVVPLVTSQFLHGGWTHLLGNMLFLWIFGDNVEDRLGHGRFLGFYLLCGIAAGLAQVLVDPLSTAPVIGASGAIAGVLGAYLASYPGARVLTLVPIFFFPWLVELPAFVFLGVWFVLQLFDGVASLGAPFASGIAFWAHTAGFLVGILLLGWLVPPGSRRRAFRRAPTVWIERPHRPIQPWH